VIPVSDDAVVSIAGTRWSLEAAPLTRGTTHGISNEALGDSIEIKVHQGVVFVVITRGE
jgi:thiamine pyrophosphokinase